MRQLWPVADFPLGRFGLANAGDDPAPDRWRQACHDDILDKAAVILWPIIRWSVLKGAADG